MCVSVSGCLQQQISISTMNELYSFVQQAFRNYSQASLLQLHTQLANNPGEISQNYGLPSNYQYVVKRLLGAVLAKEPNLKFNAYLALTLIAQSLENVKTEALYEYIASISNYKKHCEGKTTEVEAYVVGKILAVKALKSIFASNLNVINHFTDLLSKFPEYEEQIIQLISQLSTDKKSVNIFSKLIPTTKAGFVLHSILKAKLKKTELQLNENVVSDVLKELVSVYPKHSICIDYLAPLIKSSIESPAKYFQTQLAAIFQTESELNIRLLFYILQLLGGHLKGTKLTSSNIWSMVSVKVIGGWILQLKVKNKSIRKIAQSITIQFDNDQTLALQILKELHDKQLYLQNINHKHPLFQLYQYVNPHEYSQYLLTLVAKEVEEEQEREKTHKGYYNELQVFFVTRHKELTIDQIATIVVIFVNRYHAKKEESALQAINTIFNALLSSNPKKTQTLHSRPSLVLSKLKVEQMELGEYQGEVKQAIKKIRVLFKTSKEEKEVFSISFLNFLLSVGYYFLIYPEELELFSDIEMAEKDFKSNVLLSQSGLQTKKKRKLNEEDKHKSINVLIDIFISLLTKSSQFLRTNINSLFEQLIPYVDSTDISHLLEVISKPDLEYIEDTQVQTSS